MEKLDDSVVLDLNNMFWLPTEGEYWKNSNRSHEDEGLFKQRNQKLFKQIMDKWGWSIRDEKLCLLQDDGQLYFHWRLMEELALNKINFAMNYHSKPSSMDR